MLHQKKIMKSAVRSGMILNGDYVVNGRDGNTQGIEERGFLNYHR
jgi:hypothetical protein